jgi:hypothetical protein
LLKLTGRQDRRGTVQIFRLQFGGFLQSLRDLFRREFCGIQ